MNILLLTQQEKISEDTYEITQNKFLHIKNILKVIINQKLFAGRLDGLMGDAIVHQINEDSIIVKTQFEKKPPSPLPITLILALPRPKMLKRILRNVSMLGVKEIYLINTYKVEKSFWNSELLKNKKYENYFLQGLEQSRDTVMPKLYLKDRFKPFVEDELPGIIKGSTALLAHPGKYPTFPQGIRESLVLAIGPEGGFIDYEVSKLEEVGFKTVACGERILRMETAVVSLLSQHDCFLS